jgi:hypothetical protein
METFMPPGAGGNVCDNMEEATGLADTGIKLMGYLLTC